MNALTGTLFRILHSQRTERQYVKAVHLVPSVYRLQISRTRVLSFTAVLAHRYNRAWAASCIQISSRPTRPTLFHLYNIQHTTRTPERPGTVASRCLHQFPVCGQWVSYKSTIAQASFGWKWATQRRTSSREDCGKRIFVDSWYVSPPHVQKNVPLLNVQVVESMQRSARSSRK